MLSLTNYFRNVLSISVLSLLMDYVPRFAVCAIVNLFYYHKQLLAFFHRTLLFLEFIHSLQKSPRICKVCVSAVLTENIYCLLLFFLFILLFILISDSKVIHRCVMSQCVAVLFPNFPTSKLPRIACQGKDFKAKFN